MRQESQKVAADYQYLGKVMLGCQQKAVQPDSWKYCCIKAPAKCGSSMLQALAVQMLTMNLVGLSGLDETCMTWSLGSWTSTSNRMVYWITFAQLTAKDAMRGCTSCLLAGHLDMKVVVS